MHIRNKLIILSFSQAMLLSCSYLPDLNDTFAGRKVDYKKQSRSIESLEIPPQMVMSEATDAMLVPNEISHSHKASSSAKTNDKYTQLPLSQQVLPVQEDIELLKEGDVRYLRLKGTKEQVWSKMREFWINRGMLIKRESPMTGVLETEWAENRANIPEDGVRGVFSIVFKDMYSSGTRDKYRVRIEESTKPGYSELYLTHYGMEEKAVGHEEESFVWEKRPRDPELEAEMLGSMMVFFGLEEQKARILLADKEKQRNDKAIMIRSNNGKPSLLVRETFPRAWRRTGAALDKISFVVEDRDRNNGIYYVQYVDPLAEEKASGWSNAVDSTVDWFSAFWTSEESETPNNSKYQIKLTSQDDQTLVQIMGEEGSEINSSTANRILTLLYEQLK